MGFLAEEGDLDEDAKARHHDIVTGGLDTGEVAEPGTHYFYVWVDGADRRLTVSDQDMQWFNELPPLPYPVPADYVLEEATTVFDLETGQVYEVMRAECWAPCGGAAIGWDITDEWYAEMDAELEAANAADSSVSADEV